MSPWNRRTPNISRETSDSNDLERDGSRAYRGHCTFGRTRRAPIQTVTSDGRTRPSVAEWDRACAFGHSAEPERPMRRDATRDATTSDVGWSRTFVSVRFDGFTSRLRIARPRGAPRNPRPPSPVSDRFDTHDPTKNEAHSVAEPSRYTRWDTHEAPDTLLIPRARRVAGVAAVRVQWGKRNVKARTQRHGSNGDDTRGCIRGDSVKETGRHWRVRACVGRRSACARARAIEK